MSTTWWGRAVEELSGDTELVLGYDGACVACSSIARAVRRGAAGRVEVMSLHDERIIELLERSPSRSARRRDRPLLVHAVDGRVRAVGGPLLVPALVRRLGLRVASSILYELGVAARRTRVRGGDRTGPTRRTLLAGLAATAGGAIALGAASPAAATPSPRRGPIDGLPAEGRIASLYTAPVLSPEAAGRFGVVDWGGVRAGRSVHDDVELYTVPLHHPDLGVSHLVSAGETDEHAVIVRRRGPGTAARSSAPATIDLYRVDGEPLAALTASGPRKSLRVADPPRPPDLVAVPRRTPPTIAPQRTRAFWNCLNACLQANDVASSWDACYFCLSAPTPAHATWFCAQCYALAGDYFRVCTRDCAFLG